VVSPSPSYKNIIKCHKIHVSREDKKRFGQQAEATSMVYVDYLNFLMVTLSHSASHAADVGVAAFGLLSVLYYVWLAGPRESLNTRAIELRISNKYGSVTVNQPNIQRVWYIPYQAETYPR
jgi:hypothetical protein